MITIITMDSSLHSDVGNSNSHNQSQLTATVDDVPPDAVNVDDVPPDAVNVDDVPPDAVNVDDVPPDAINVDDAPPDAINVDDAPTGTVNVDDAPTTGAVNVDEPKKVLREGKTGGDKLNLTDTISQATVTDDILINTTTESLSRVLLTDNLEFSEPKSEVGAEENINENSSLIDHKLRTIETYKTLAANVNNHRVLLQEATVSGFLVLCLGDENPLVAERSFEVFLALFQYPENVLTLRNLKYLMEGLRCVCYNRSVKKSVSSDAEKMIAELQSVSSKCHPHPQPLVEQSESKKNVQSSKEAVSGSFQVLSGSVVQGTVDAKMTQPVNLNSTMSTIKRKNKGRETVIFIGNEVIQQKLERTRITQVLITVPGIISVTYDLKKNQCVVRGKRNVASENFAKAIAANGFSGVYLVRRNENKEETKILIQSDKENFPYPSYPEEVENDEVDESSAVAAKDQLHTEGASLFKSAKNFIKRSFYW